MTSKPSGVDTSRVEVQNISPHGIWILVRDREYFLDYQRFPWFLEAKVADIVRVELLHDTHLYWPGLDVDLDVQCLDDPQSFPLVYRS